VSELSQAEASRDWSLIDRSCARNLGESGPAGLEGELSLEVPGTTCEDDLVHGG
jgi:hypothetical protein